VPSVPSDIGTLGLWVKSDTGVYTDAGVTPATHGQSVQQWNDQSGNGRHLTQATAGNRPVYQTSANTLNALPSLQFSSGSSQFFNIPDFLAAGAVAAAEIFAVFRKSVDPPASSTSSGFWRFGSSGTLSAHAPATNGRIYEAFGSTSRHGREAGLGMDGHDGIEHYDDFSGTTDPDGIAVYNVHAASNDYAVREGLGRVMYTSSTNTVGWTTAPTLGRSVNASFHSGWWAELFLFTAKLSDSDRADMFTYIGTRYAQSDPLAGVTQSAALALRAGSGTVHVEQSFATMLRAVRPAQAFISQSAVVLVRQRVSSNKPRLTIIGL
jgi:hypothetical protein